MPDAIQTLSTGIPNDIAEHGKPSARPVRIVSLDYCADQYLLKLADREQILAVSPDAVKPFSYMRETAQGVPVVRPSGEDVMILSPDLVIRSYGGGPGISTFLSRADIPVLQLDWVASIDDNDGPSVASMIRTVAADLGQAERGEQLIDTFQSRLDRVAHNNENHDRQQRQSALYMTAGGVTSGPGSLLHQMLDKAGLDNFQTQPGWHPLPLEQLAYEQPDVVAAAFFDTVETSTKHWSASRHPIAQQQLSEQNTVPLQAAWVSCGGWFLIEAIEALAQAVN